MKPVLICINALQTNARVLGDFSGRPIWEETIRRVNSLSDQADVILLRSSDDLVLPPACGIDQCLVDGAGSHAVLSALRTAHSGYAWYVFIDLASALLDPALITSFVETGKRQMAHYVYGEHFPQGIAPEVLSAEALEILHGVSSGQDYVFSDTAIFDLMGLDINAWDIEMVVSKKDFRRMRLDLRVLTEEAAFRMQALLKRDPGLSTDWAWDRLSDLLWSAPELLRIIPAYVELDLVDACQLACAFCPRILLPPPLGEVMPLEVVRSLVEQVVAIAPEATIALSPFSEPLLHPDFVAILRLIMDTGLRLVVETNGLALDEPLAKALAECDPERAIVIVSLDFSDPARYQREKGAELLQQAEDNLRRLLGLRSRNVWLQAIQFAGDDAGLDAFYERWKDHADAILPRKFNNWCQRLPGQPAVDLSPLVRTPCWHLARDLVIRVDGRVGMCKQDLEGEAFVGNVISDGVLAVWQQLGERWTAHCADEISRGHALCQVCDEWHTFNF